MKFIIVKNNYLILMKVSMKYLISFILLGIVSFACTDRSVIYRKKPKLVVGVVVDQMRAEYLNRYQHQFGEGGFKRLMNE